MLSKSSKSCVKVSCENLGWKYVILTELNCFQNSKKLLASERKKGCFVNS